MHSAEQARPPAASRIFDPFSEKSDLAWINTRVQEGYFGPTASYDRSPSFQSRFEYSSLPRIRALQKSYQDLLSGAVKDRTVTLKPADQDGPERVVPWTKDLEMRQLEQEWREIPKGGREEMAWTERAVAFAVAGFEKYMQDHGHKDFAMRDNQVYYMTILALGKGAYEFGDLETKRRGIELPTGEGKTFSFGLVAPIMGMKSDGPVVVMEPSYVSAQSHAGQLGEFYDSFFHHSTGAVVSVPEKEGIVKRSIADEHGVFSDRLITTGGLKSYRHMNGSLVEEPGRDGRQKAWKQKIVYIDPESLAFDWLNDRQIGPHDKTGQPPLAKMTMMVAEADGLMLDNARNPFITSEMVKGNKAWDAIGDLSGFEQMYPSDWPEQSRHATTQRAMFTIWANLYEAKRTGYFKEGFGKDKDYTLVNRQLVDSERLSFKARNIIARNLSSLFGYDETEEEARVGQWVNTWGAADMSEKKGWDSAINQIRNIYRFENAASEQKLRQLFAENLPKSRLAARIVDTLRADHDEVVMKSVSAIINSDETDESKVDPPVFDAAKVNAEMGELVPRWLALSLGDKHDQAIMIKEIARHYPIADRGTRGKLAQLLSGNPSRDGLAGHISALLKDDYDAMMAKRFPEADPVIERELSFLTPANRRAFQDLSRWIDGNSDVMDAALQSLFGMQNQVDFIGKDKPVLLDEYGFPLEKRQLQDMQQVFLQLHHAWQKEGMEGKTLTSTLLTALEEKYAPEIEISQTMSRITLPALLEQCENVLFSSGSLIPAAKPFADLYAAEVLSVERHLDVPHQIPEAAKASILTKCLDGGLAQVEYLEDEEHRTERLTSLAEKIGKKGNMGLLIVPDIRTAAQLKELLPDAELATGAEELETRGTLDKVTSVGAPGKIIITTWIAHRDIDVKLPPEVLKNGGLDCIVSGIPPTERGLWQALQRSLRGDMPGTRTLLLEPDDLIPMKNRDLVSGPSATLIHRPPEKTHAEAVRKIDEKYKEALKGDRHAMEYLFKDYLGYLRGKTNEMSRQLTQIMIRDSDLEKWQQAFVESRGHFNEQSEEYMKQVNEEARRRQRPVEVPSMEYAFLRQREADRRTEQVLTHLQSQLGFVTSDSALVSRMVNQIKQEDLRDGWADFLKFLEIDSYLYLSNPEMQKLRPEAQRAKFRSHIDSLLAEPAAKT